MWVESWNNFDTSQKFVDIFAKIYEDKTLTSAELQELTNAKESFENQNIDIALGSILERTQLSYAIESGEQNLRGGASPLWDKKEKEWFYSENQVLKTLKQHPAYSQSAIAFRSLTTLERKAIQAVSFQNPSAKDIDGKFWVNTFTALRNSMLFKKGMTIEEISQYFHSIKTQFNRLSSRARKNYQRLWGKDGVYGPNTFANIVKEGKDTEILWIEVQKALQSIDSGISQQVPDISEFIQAAPPVFNNGLEMSDTEFTALKESVRENGSNPSYKEFRASVSKLSREEKSQLQRAVNAGIDGKPGIGTYTHFLHSKVYEAWFSVEEVATLKTITAENTQEQIKQINEAFDIDLNELPTNVGQNDMVSYEPNYGILTVVDHEDGIKSEIDVAQGIFDTISSVLSADTIQEEDREKIFITLDQMNGKTELQAQYVEALKKYIYENQSYAQAREIFCVPGVEEIQEGTLYTIDFRWMSVLSRLMVAQDIFWDIPYVKNQEATYINRQEPERDYLVFDGSRRLSIKSWRNILVPNIQEQEKIQQNIELLEREQEIREAIEGQLLQTLTSENTAVILEYLELDTVTKKEKASMIQSLKEQVYSQKLFVHMRNMFCLEVDGAYVFRPGNDFLWSEISAFDIFWDYKTLVSQWRQFHSIREKTYTNTIDKLSLTVWWSPIQPQEWSRRNEKDYEILQEWIHPEYAQKLWKYLQKLSVWSAQWNCARGVADILMWKGRYSPSSELEHGVQVDRSHARNWDNLLDKRVATWQFKKVKIQHPKEAKAWGIVCYNQWAQAWSTDRKRYGHVELCDGTGNYLYDWKTNTPAGSCYRLSKSKQDRDIIRGTTSNPDRFKQLTAFTGYVYYPTRRA